MEYKTRLLKYRWNGEFVQTFDCELNNIKKINTKIYKYMKNHSHMVNQAIRSFWTLKKEKKEKNNNKKKYQNPLKLFSLL